MKTMRTRTLLTATTLFKHKASALPAPVVSYCHSKIEVRPIKKKISRLLPFLSKRSAEQRKRLICLLGHPSLLPLTLLRPSPSPPAAYPRERQPFRTTAAHPPSQISVSRKVYTSHRPPPHPQTAISSLPQRKPPLASQTQRRT